MKKTYINPTLTVVKVQPAQVIATSSIEMYGKDAEGVGMGREARFYMEEDWEEDWEEDY